MVNYNIIICLLLLGVVLVFTPVHSKSAPRDKHSYFCSTVHSTLSSSNRWLTGKVNDYVGKGMHGGEIAVLPVPEADAGFVAADSSIVGNIWSNWRQLSC